MSEDDFQLQPPEVPRTISALEPLYSMLQDAPLSALEYLHRELSKTDTDSQLDDIIPSLGISRKRAIEQTWLVLSQRKR